MKNLGYYNGKFGPLEEMMVPMNDRVCYFGDGVYDATYSRNGVIFALDEHIDRFFNSAGLLRIELPCTKDEMKDILNDMVGKVDGGVAHDKAGGAVDHALRRLKYAHADIPCVGHDEHGSRRLEYPAKKYPCVDVVEVISVCDKLDQLQRHDEGEDHAGDGQYHVVREGADHAVNAGVPRLRGAADVSRRLRDLGVDVIKEAGEVVHDAPDQQLL